MPSELIQDFDAIAARYDLLTRLNPGYLAHLRWSAERLRLAPGARILDLCCGTGLSTAALAAVYPDAKSITGLDASAGMLAYARKNVLTRPGGPQIDFVQGDAMDPAAALPAAGVGSRSAAFAGGRSAAFAGAGVDSGSAAFAGTFDGILMAYGIRNVPDRDLCLKRLRALLAPGAPICFHEYSVADSKRARLVWNTVARSVIAPLGVLATGQARMWRYLRESVNAFDGVGTFEARLGRAGFVEIETLPMNGWQRGIVHSFLARAPRA